jgi:hypothetical protein
MKADLPKLFFAELLYLWSTQKGLFSTRMIPSNSCRFTRTTFLSLLPFYSSKATDLKFKSSTGIPSWPPSPSLTQREKKEAG